MPTWTSLAGLALVFLGVATVILMAGIIGKERSQVSASMAAIEAISGPVPDEMRTQYDQPFNTRVTKPVQAWLANARADTGGRELGQEHHPAPRHGREPSRAGTRSASWRPRPSPRIVVRWAGRPVHLVDRARWSALLWGIVLRRRRVLPARPAAGQHGPEACRADPEGPAEQHRPADGLRGIRARLRRGAGPGGPQHRGPLSDEFRRVLREIQIGSSRSDALQGPGRPDDVDDLRIFLNSMIQAEKLGIPIADVLRVQASEMRLKKSQRTEEQAMKLPVKLVFPLLLCIMPRCSSSSSARPPSAFSLRRLHRQRATKVNGGLGPAPSLSPNKGANTCCRRLTLWARA